jgi:hypothetical protein
MPAIAQDDLSLPEPPAWMQISDWDRVRWPLADRTERRRMQGRAVARIQDEFSRETNRREQAAEEARDAARAELPPIPSLEDCTALIVGNPDNLRTMQLRALHAYRICRSYPAAPIGRIDSAWTAFRQSLANQTAARMLQLACAAEHFFLELALHKNEFSHMSWTDAENRRQSIELAHAEQQRLTGQSFDAAKFISNLASRGIRLQLKGEFNSIRITGNAGAVTAADRLRIEQHRTVVADALRLSEEV